METIAIYWEKRAKTYGFTIETDLCLLQSDLADTTAADRVLQLAEAAEPHRAFKSALLGRDRHGRQRLLVLVDDKCNAAISRFLNRRDRTDGTMSVAIQAPVDTLYFHGPHFSDRYGIVHSTIRALKQKAIPLLALSCTANSVQCILPASKGRSAMEALSEVFQVPGAK